MNSFLYYQDGHEAFDEMALEAVIPEADAVDAAGRPFNQQSIADLLINAEVLMDHEDSKQLAKVVRQSVEPDGKVLGGAESTAKSLIYDVEFPDGVVKKYSANVIAENILSQVDQSGFHSQSIERIINHERMGNAVSRKNAFITTKRGVRKLRHTTVGWKFHC